MSSPRDWKNQIMVAHVCTVCGWREGLGNTQDLHQEHLTHVLAMQEQSELAPPFDPKTHGKVMRGKSRKPARVPSGPLSVWLTKDPETERVTVQAREQADGDTPRGARGVGWPWRHHIIDGKQHAALLRGQLSPDEQDQLHRQWWTEAAPEGVGPWPE